MVLGISIDNWYLFLFIALGLIPWAMGVGFILGFLFDIYWHWLFPGIFKECPLCGDIKERRIV